MVVYFQNKIVFVTGGASGLGLALCESLAKSKASVIIADLNFEKANEIANQLTSDGFNVSAVKLDVADAEAFNSAIQHTVGTYGKLDVLINNAGINIVGEVHKLSIQDWQKVLDVNLSGVVNGTSIAYKIMTAQRSGQIVNISSLAGFVPCPMNAPYTAAKFAVVGLTKALRLEAEQHGIKVNLVCPGYINTPIFESSSIPEKNKKGSIELSLSKLLPAEKAAELILKGVMKNRSLIIFPFYSRLAWWLIRLNSNSLNSLSRLYMRSFRRS